MLESEQLLKIFFAEHGTKQDAQATLAAARAWAEERNQDNIAAGRAYEAGEAEFQWRVAQTMLVGAFLTDFYRLVADWADWAAGLVESWPDEPGKALVDPDEMARIVHRASWDGSAP